AKLARCDVSAASILAKTWRHCASKLSAPTTLPLRSVATWPAMNRNSDALTRASCEYWPSGLPSASGFSIVMLGMMVLAALRLDLTRKSLGDRSRLARDARTARDGRWALTSLLPSYPVVWRPIFESSGHSGKCNSKTHRSWSQRVAAMQEPAWISWRIGVARAASPWQGRPHKTPKEKRRG